MLPTRETLRCQYHYDPLDRLIATTLSAEARVQRFYQKDRLVTEIQGATRCSIMQYEDQLLAQQTLQSGTAATHLLATDQQRSVFNVLDTNPSRPFAYTAYGHRPANNIPLSLLGFNGERVDRVTGGYLLGSFRVFNPVLMRFNSPDCLPHSPFGAGGLNPYAYCGGDPINFSDSTGHLPVISKFIKQLIEVVSDIKTTATQSATRNPNFIGPIAKPRHLLREALTEIENPSSYAKNLASVNNNFISHGDATLSKRQALFYAGNARDSSNGAISLPTAYVRGTPGWAMQAFSTRDARAAVGLVFNAVAALFSGPMEKSMVNTGKALRRGSITPQPRR